jgi:zinc/manganese transport system substrate-binding protein
MPAVAAAVAADLSGLQPQHAQYFRANLARFDRSLRPWRRELAKVASTYPDAPVATTEPVADDLLQAAGLDIKTPDMLEGAVMNGTDPSPQDVTAQRTLLSDREVDLFVYNRQASDSITQSFLSSARSAGVPEVGVYETMPSTAEDYQDWMLATTTAVFNALHSAQSATGP